MRREWKAQVSSMTYELAKEVGKTEEAKLAKELMKQTLIGKPKQDS